MAQKSNESINNDLRYQILKARMEVYEIQRSFNSLNNSNCYYNEDTILKGILEAAKEAAKENEQESTGVNIEKLLSALDKIANKLLNYKYPDAHNILNLKEFITSDPSTHLDKRYINQIIYRMDRLINEAEDDLDANELMVLYFGIYLARIKNKEIRQVKISRRI